MSVFELRDPEEARRFIWQGLFLQRVAVPNVASVKLALEWALELAGGGEPLPPVGFIADVGHVALGVQAEGRTGHDAHAVAGLPPGLARTYEDYVLGKLYADWTFERASDALCRYQGRDRAKGLAFLLNQFRGRAGFGGVLLSPAIIRTMLDRNIEEALAQGWETLSRGELLPLLPQMYEELIGTVRNTAEVLGPEDIFEVEHGTAVAPFSQRLALRQVLQAAAHLEASLPRHRIRPLSRRQEVPTRVLDEDTYPVGGYSSLSTRGTVESLLYSQLAYMEQGERPDLFDIKYLRDELLYYSRDENQFLRQRRTFHFALYPDLVQARFKDAELPWQRIVLLLAVLLAAVRKLTEWLSADALVFEFLFLEGPRTRPLAAERELLEMLLREQIANKTVHIDAIHPNQLAARCALRARRSLCHCLTISTTDQRVQTDATFTERLRLDGPRPALGVGDEALQYPEADDAMASWSATLERLLQIAV
jgi:hypothetical protein